MHGVSGVPAGDRELMAVVECDGNVVAVGELDNGLVSEDVMVITLGFDGAPDCDEVVAEGVGGWSSLSSDLSFFVSICRTICERVQ